MKTKKELIKAIKNKDFGTPDVKQRGIEDARAFYKEQKEEIREVEVKGFRS